MNASTAYFIISVALTGTLSEFSWASDEPRSIEVFTDATFQEVTGIERATVYVIDRIDQLQRELSSDLPRDPENAKQAAIQRLQGMDANVSSQLENAARGLVQAIHYGIDRYPGIVFDGAVVVYGVTDLNAATRIYHQWLAEGAR